MSDSGLSMIGRPVCLLPGLAITNNTVADRDFSQCGNWANCALMVQSRGRYVGNHFISVNLITFLLDLAKNG